MMNVGGAGDRQRIRASDGVGSLDGCIDVHWLPREIHFMMGIPLFPERYKSRQSSRPRAVQLRLFRRPSSILPRHIEALFFSVPLFFLFFVVCPLSLSLLASFSLFLFLYHYHCLLSFAPRSHCSPSIRNPFDSELVSRRRRYYEGPFLVQTNTMYCHEIRLQIRNLINGYRS